MRVLKKIWWIPLAVYMIVIPSFISDRVFTESCRKIEVKIIDSASYRFVTRDLLFSLVQNENTKTLGNPIGEVDIGHVEAEIRAIKELESVEVYSTANGVLHIDANQRDPIVRIITSFGNSYYIDKFGEIIPHNSSFTPRVTVVTGNITVPDISISAGNINSLPETSLMKSVIRVVNSLNDSELWAGQVEQIWITEEGNIEIIPRVGNHVVKIGKPEKLETKLKTLEALYREALPLVGWNRYNEINLMYEGQVVCKRR